MSPFASHHAHQSDYTPGLHRNNSALELHVISSQSSRGCMDSGVTFHEVAQAKGFCFRVCRSKVVGVWRDFKEALFPAERIRKLCGKQSISEASPGANQLLDGTHHVSCDDEPKHSRELGLSSRRDSSQSRSASTCTEAAL